MLPCLILASCGESLPGVVGLFVNHATRSRWPTVPSGWHFKNGVCPKVSRKRPGCRRSGASGRSGKSGQYGEPFGQAKWGQKCPKRCGCFGRGPISIALNNVAPCRLSPPHGSHNKVITHAWHITTASGCQLTSATLLDTTAVTAPRHKLPDSCIGSPAGQVPDRPSPALITNYHHDLITCSHSCSNLSPTTTSPAATSQQRMCRVCGVDYRNKQGGEDRYRQARKPSHPQRPAMC